MRVTFSIAGCLAALAALACAGPALADTTVEARTVWRFDAMRYLLDTGAKLTFKNADAASPGPHNVTSTQKGADGKPLFASETIKNGEQSPVTGAQALKAGQYDFICTVHPFMQATLVVADASAAPAPAPADTRRPKVRTSIVRTSLRSALKAKRLFAVVTSDERVTLDVAIVARVKGRTVRLGRARRVVGAPGRQLRVAVPLGATARRALRRLRSASLTLLVEARDGAGNLTATKARRVLRRS
jgi:plastocyanin